MVLPHACALEKEFNERVVVLMASVCSQLEADRLANDDASLDRFIAPLCTYNEVEPRLHLGAKTGTRLGTFPVPESPWFGIPQAWVDLRRMSTTDVRLTRLGAAGNMRVEPSQTCTVRSSPK
jgi:hypothetical protein